MVFCPKGFLSRIFKEVCFFRNFFSSVLSKFFRIIFSLRFFLQRMFSLRIFFFFRNFLRGLSGVCFLFQSQLFFTVLFSFFVKGFFKKKDFFKGVVFLPKGCFFLKAFFADFFRRFVVPKDLPICI